jgi:hypothetical protein
VVVSVPPEHPGSPAIDEAPLINKLWPAVTGKGWLKLTLVSGAVVELFASVILRLVASPGNTVALLGATGPVLTVTLKSLLI